MIESKRHRLGDVGAMARVTRAIDVGSDVAGTNSAVMKKRQLIAGFCRLIGDQLEDGKPAPLSDRPLSPRERQTLELLLAGDSEKQIAFKLSLSPHTVHVYVKSLYKRFNVSSRGELLARWIKK